MYYLQLEEKKTAKGRFLSTMKKRSKTKQKSFKNRCNYKLLFTLQSSSTPAPTPLHIPYCSPALCCLFLFVYSDKQTKVGSLVSKQRENALCLKNCLSPSIGLIRPSKTAVQFCLPLPSSLYLLPRKWVSLHPLDKRTC